MYLAPKSNIIILLFALFIIILSITEPVSIVYSRYHVIKYGKLKYHKITFLDSDRILYIETLEDKVFYIYRGLYVGLSPDDSRIINERDYIIRKYAPEFNISIPYNETGRKISSLIHRTEKWIWVVRDAYINEEGKAMAFINRSILEIFKGTGLYPLKIRIIGFSSRIFIYVSSNSTIKHETALINALNKLLPKIGLKKYTRVFIFKTTERDPIMYALFNKYETRIKIWHLVENKMKELLDNCNESTKKYCDLNYEYNIKHCIATTTTGDLFICNGIHFYLGTWGKKPLTTIWDLVNNETYRERLNAYLDLLADAFSEVARELGIDYYGIRAIIMSNRLTAAVGDLFASSSASSTEINSQIKTPSTLNDLASNSENNLLFSITIYPLVVLVIIVAGVIVYKRFIKK